MLASRKIHLPRATGDLVALGALSALAFLFAGFLLRDDVFIYGDHPGHYWLLWYTLNVAAPEQHRLITWVPYWYAGYTELQFTPPGYVLLGYALNALTAGIFSTALVYEIVAFIGYALPGFTFFYAVRHLGLGRATAFSAGVLALVFPAVFDGATGAFIGMIGSRLAFGLNALFFAWTIDALEQRGARYFFAAAFALAALVLAHPYHAIGMFIALGVYMLLRRLPILRAGMRVGAIVLVAAALDAFWLAPLFAHASGAMIPMLRATRDQTWHILTDGALMPFALLALFSLLRWRRDRAPQPRAVLAALLTLVFALPMGMQIAHIVLIEQRQFFQLDPIRLIGEYYFALIWLAALGAVELAEWCARRASQPIVATMLRACVIGGVGAYFVFAQWQPLHNYQPRSDAEPRFLSQVEREYNLTELWEVLRENEGRVWFTAFTSGLDARGTETWFTTLTALTPLYTRREMMGGTYSHWSPTAARMWSGAPWPRVLHGLNHEQDNRALFGVPLENFSEAALLAECARYNITTLVANRHEERTRTLLDGLPSVQSYYNNGYYFVYRVTDRTSAWFDAQNATVTLVDRRDDRLVVRVDAAHAHARVQLRIHKKITCDSCEALQHERQV